MPEKHDHRRHRHDDDRQLQRIEDKVDALRSAFESFQQIFLHLEVHQMATLDDMLAEIERDTTVSEGIAHLIDQLRAEVQAAGGNQAKIDEAFNRIKANTDKLAEKLVVNTPNAEEQPA